MKHRGNSDGWLCFCTMCSAVAFITCLGCDSSGLDLVPGRGVVQLEGKPIDGGKLLLSPTSKGQFAIGQIQPDGTFSLTTRSEEGALPGEYRVTVVTDLTHKGKDVHMTCIGPRQFIISHEKDTENNFEIDIRRSKGWLLTGEDKEE